MSKPRTTIVATASIALAVAFAPAARAQDQPQEVPTAQSPEAPVGSAQAPAPAQPVQPYNYQPYEYQPRREPYSPGTALMLSLGGTAFGYGMLVLGANRDNSGLATVGLVGALVGPSAGHIYTGDTTHAITLSLLRGLGGVMFVAGVLSALSHDCGGPDCNDVSFWVYGGITLTVGSTLYSIIDAPSSARRANDRANRNLTLTPAPMVGPARSMGLGMTLSGRF